MYAIVKISPDIKNVVSKNTRLYINMSSHRVTDYYHVLQCYTCESFGHKTSSCPLANTGDSICLYCAGKHTFKTCNLKTMSDEHKCSNCLKNTSLDIRKQAKSHTLSSPQCPLLIREQKKIMLKTKIFTKTLVKNSKSLKFLSFNYCSVRSKVPQICDFLTNQNIDIALLQEPWLKKI